VEVAAARRYWALKDVASKLRPHQRILAVPGTFACSNQTYQSLDQADVVVTKKLRAYVQWAAEDSRLAGLWPWHLTNRTKSQNSGPCDMKLGCEALPGCMAEVRAIGAALRRHAGGLKSDDDATARVPTIDVFVPRDVSVGCTSNFANRSIPCQYLGFRIPGLVHVGNGTLLAFAEGRKYGNGGDDFGPGGAGMGQHDLVMRRSTDSGRSFGKLVTLIDAVDFAPWRVLNPEAANDRGSAVWDPTPLWDSVTDTVWVFFNGPGRVGSDCHAGLCSTWASSSTGASDDASFFEIEQQYRTKHKHLRLRVDPELKVFSSCHCQIKAWPGERAT
jgi:hypothetical protein